MGQQQLLLIILVTIVVGIATIVATESFNAATDSANINAVRQDIATFASAAKGYYMKPEMLGGGGGDFEGITFRSVAFPADRYSSDNRTVLNDNGVYTFPAPGSDDTLITITAYPASRINGPVTLNSIATEEGGSLKAVISPDGLHWIDNQ